MKIRDQYRALLDRAQGYTTQARRRLQARRTTGIAQRSGDLARAISARYGLLEQRWPLMAFIFEQPERPAGTISNTYHTTHPSILLNPRVLLRMLVSHRAEKQRATADRNPAQAFNRGAAHMTLAASPGQKQRPQEQDDVIARIVRRAVRNESPFKTNTRSTSRTNPRTAQTAPMENDAFAQTPSLSRVFRHSAKAKDDASPIVATARTEREKPSAAAMRESSATITSQTPLDITRITDQVMQTLDRRIVAQRERMGRG